MVARYLETSIANRPGFGNSDQGQAGELLAGIATSGYKSFGKNGQDALAALVSRAPRATPGLGDTHKASASGVL